jgi:hypothetical protein
MYQKHNLCVIFLYSISALALSLNTMFGTSTASVINILMYEILVHSE